MLAGFAYSTLVYEGTNDFTSVSRTFRTVFDLIAFSSMLLNMAALFGSTVCAMLGPGLALRGQDGAMDQAVEGLALEYRTTFILFLGGVFTYYCCFRCVRLRERGPRHACSHCRAQRTARIVRDANGALSPLRACARSPSFRRHPRCSITLGLDYDSSYGWADFAVQLLLFFCFFFFLRSTLKACKRIYKKFRLPPESAVAGAFDPDWTPRVSPETAELTRLSARKAWHEWPRRQYLWLVVFMNEFVGISHQVGALARTHAARTHAHTQRAHAARSAHAHTQHCRLSCRLRAQKSVSPQRPSPAGASTRPARLTAATHTALRGTLQKEQQRSRALPRRRPPPAQPRAAPHHQLPRAAECQHAPPCRSRARAAW